MMKKNRFRKVQKSRQKSGKNISKRGKGVPIISKSGKNGKPNGPDPNRLGVGREDACQRVFIGMI